MQHRSLIRTREWTPQSSVSETPIVRNHSPYCEATGPIVRDGFVAARIRALQDLQSKALRSSRSHSPMLPCPPRTLQNFERDGAPPPPAWLTKPVVNRLKSSREEVAQQSHKAILPHQSQKQLMRVTGQTAEPSGTVLTPQSQDSQALLVKVLKQTRNPFAIILPLQGQETQKPVAILGSYLSGSNVSTIERFDAIGVRTPSEAGVLSPRAIPANLADPEEPWRDFSQTEQHDSGTTHGQRLVARRSIADRLGSLVEHGWVGSDLFGKAYNDRLAANYIAHESDNHPETGNRLSQSFGEDPHHTRLPVHKQSPSCSPSRAPSSCHCSITPETMNIVYPFTIVGPREGMNKRKKHTTTTKKTSQRSSSDVDHYTPTPTKVVSSPPQKERVFSLRHLNSSPSQHFELDTISPSLTSNRRSGEKDCKAISHFLSSGNLISTPKRRPQAYSKSEDSQSSESAPVAPSLRRASTNTTPSTRAAVRSTSWFKKYRFLPKLVPVKKQPLLLDLATSNESNGTAENNFKTDAQHGQQSQGANKAQDVADCGNGDDDRQTNVDSIGADILKGSEKATEDGPMLQKAFSESAAIPETESQRLWDKFQLPAKSSQAFGLQATGSESSMDLQKRSSPFQVEHFSKHSRIPLPESSSARPTMFKSTNLTSEIANSLDQYPWEIMQDSSMSPKSSTHTASVKLRLDGSPEPVSFGSRTRTPRPESPAVSPLARSFPELDNFSLQQRARSAHDTASMMDSPKTVRMESRARNRNVKKIQVTITFDGAEELVVEAKLQRNTKREGSETLR